MIVPTTNYYIVKVGDKVVIKKSVAIEFYEKLLLLFSGFFGGYLGFLLSIGWIGMVTAAVGDIASHLGCFINLKDAVNAITFITIGTALPDTFASKLAAIQVNDNISFIHFYYYCYEKMDILHLFNFIFSQRWLAKGLYYLSSIY